MKRKINLKEMDRIIVEILEIQIQQYVGILKTKNLCLRTISIYLYLVSRNNPIHFYLFIYHFFKEIPQN